MGLPNALSASESLSARVQSRLRLDGEFTERDLQRFRSICSQHTEHCSYPLSDAIIHNVVIYSGEDIRNAIEHDVQTQSQTARARFMEEIQGCLLSGPGVCVIKNLVPNRDVLDRATKALTVTIEKERCGGQVKGDHFAAAGTNDRLWNSFQKHALADPDSFVEYYANEIYDLVFESWLGPGYQVTAQTNVVKPGGKAQTPHRDYHLGFQSEATASQFPIVSQIASQLLTLQGAIAHTDMSLASGPTKLLPYSQHFDYGYVAYRHPEFVKIFDEAMVQVELEAGDGVFFNPALFHAAGSNTTADFDRMANLLQISACWSKPMETVDRDLIARTTWPSVLASVKRGPLGIDSPRITAVLKAICDGYSFPTNLDTDPPPKDGHCPTTQYDRIRQAASKAVIAMDLEKTLADYAEKRKA